MYSGVEESIYNIVPPEVVKVEKPPMHKSVHPGNSKPTATTFGLAQTSLPGVSNMAGDPNAVECGPHKYQKPRAQWGPPKFSQMPDTKKFLKSCEKTSHVASLNLVKKHAPEALAVTRKRSAGHVTKPGLPDPKDKPIMNLVTSKNFIVSNAVEAILAAPKKTSDKEGDFMNKEDFGKVPQYLTKIKSDIEGEYEYIRQLREEEEDAKQQVRALRPDEREQLLAGLKAKWEQVNHEYQGTTHLTKLDSVGKKERKERSEALLTQLEKDIEKMKRENIEIDMTK